MKESDKTIIHHSINNMLYKLLNILFPLVSVSYVSHVIFAEGIGKVTSAQNFAAYFILISGLGIPNYGIREIAKARTNSKKLNTTVSELFLINLVSSIICTLIYYFIVLCFVTKMRNLYLLVGAQILLNCINIDWFFQGLEEYSFITKRSIIVKMLVFVALVLFVRSPEDYYTYALLNIIGMCGNNALNVIRLRRTVHLHFDDICIKKHMKSILTLLCTTITVELYTLVDVSMLTVISNSEHVAYYSNPIKIIKLVIILISSFGGVLLPRLSSIGKEINNERDIIVNKMMNLMLFLYIPCTLGLLIIGDDLILVLFGSSFSESIKTLRIGVILFFSLGFSNLFGTQVLLTFNCEKKLLFSTCVGAITNIILNSIMIPKLLEGGAIIASIISESLVTFITFHASKRFIKYRVNFKMIMGSILSTMIMSGAVFLVRQLVNNMLVRLLLSVICGLIVFIIISYLYRLSLYGNKRIKTEIRKEHK